MAEGLLAHGARVGIVSRAEKKVEARARELAERFTGRCFGWCADITNESSLGRLIEKVSERFSGGLNIAVNSAGINIRNPIEKVSLQEWESVQRTNSTGGFLFAKSVFPLLRRARWGRLINVTSIFASRSFPDRASYAASKGALLQLTRTLSLEWAPYGITVNSISPGPFLTEINQPVLADHDNYRKFCELIPLARFGEPNEIITACLFLASPASSFVTGADLPVDGGWTAK
jgi:NAD(P)-dependent dehydrogenase (short-subunit alcohol dehydrogenase family)